MLKQIGFTYPFLVVAVMDVGCDGSLLKALTLISIYPLDVVMTIDLVTLYVPRIGPLEVANTSFFATAP